MSAPIVLASRLDLPAANALCDTLKSQTDETVVLDMRQVTYLGALCMQVMLSAATSANADGRAIKLVNTSDRVLDQLRVVGMTPEAISRGRT